jgi:hypothetical protein
MPVVPDAYFHRVTVGRHPIARQAPIPDRLPTHVARQNSLFCRVLCPPTLYRSQRRIQLSPVWIASEAWMACLKSYRQP